MPGKTAMLDRAIPVLASLEIATSLDFFHTLGFETHDFGDHNYGIAIREHIEIHFWLCTDRHVAENTSCYVRVNDIHALHADFARRIDVGEVVETPWGMDELHVFDPSGCLVKFGQTTDRLIRAVAVQETSSDSWSLVQRSLCIIARDRTRLVPANAHSEPRPQTSAAPSRTRPSMTDT